jgi:hypothetical protein
MVFILSLMLMVRLTVHDWHAHAARALRLPSATGFRFVFEKDAYMSDPSLPGPKSFHFCEPFLRRCFRLRAPGDRNGAFTRQKRLIALRVWLTL